MSRIEDWNYDSPRPGPPVYIKSSAKLSYTSTWWYSEAYPDVGRAEARYFCTISDVKVLGRGIVRARVGILAGSCERSMT